MQVRTIAEEVYAEFDHYVKYPYRENNHFLKRYTSVVAELLNSVDEIIRHVFSLEKQAGMTLRNILHKTVIVTCRECRKNRIREKKSRFQEPTME